MYEEIKWSLIGKKEEVKYMRMGDCLKLIIIKYRRSKFRILSSVNGK